MLIAEVPGLEAVARIVRHHHESYDGTGYPDGLAGRDIPLASRILSVADAYTAMTEDRPYRRARPRFEVDREFSDSSGTQFDPYVVAALRDVVGDR
jgi:polar amino acid transport system substrate-binding protein